MSAHPMVIAAARAMCSYSELPSDFEAVWNCPVGLVRAEYIKDAKAVLDAIGAVELLEALQGMLERYVSLVNSGDAGFWDCETEPEVIAARAAIAKAGGAA